MASMLGRVGHKCGLLRMIVRESIVSNVLASMIVLSFRVWLCVSRFVDCVSQYDLDRQSCLSDYSPIQQNFERFFRVEKSPRIPGLFSISD